MQMCLTPYRHRPRNQASPGPPGCLSSQHCLPVLHSPTCGVASTYVHVALLYPAYDCSVLCVPDNFTSVCMLQGLSICGAQQLCQGWATILLLGLATSRQLLLQLLACLMISQCWISLTGMGQVSLCILSLNTHLAVAQLPSSYHRALHTTGCDVYSHHAAGVVPSCTLDMP